MHECRFGVEPTWFPLVRVAATHKSFIFLIGTNYLDRIDPAAKPSGRSDREFLIVYPDAESRRALMVGKLSEALDELVKTINKEEEERLESAAEKYLEQEDGRV